MFVALAPSSDADTAHVAEGEADALALVHQRPPPACRMTRAGTGVSWVERTWTGRRNQRWAEAVSHYRQREAAWLDGRWRKRGRLSGDSPPEWLAKLEGKRFVAVTELPKAGEAVSLPTG